MRTILAIAAVCVAASVCADEQAPVTFSGKGKTGIEVRDSKGQVTQVVGPSSLRLNQIPADAAAREDSYRAKQRELADDAAKKRAEAAAAERKASVTPDAGKKKGDANAASSAVAAAKKQEDEHPLKVRRKVVRGTRYVPKNDSPNESDQGSAESSGAAASAKQSKPE